MFVAYTGDTEHELCFFLPEVYAFRVLEEYDAALLYGAFRLRGPVGDGDAHAHVGGDKLFTLLHGFRVRTVHIAQLRKQFAGCLNGFFLGYGFLAQPDAVCDENALFDGHIGNDDIRVFPGGRCRLIAGGELDVQGIQRGIRKEIPEGDELRLRC